MTQPPTPKQPPALPSNRAFVVQFSAQAGALPAWWSGRVEHLRSGQAIHFASWEQLQAFLSQVLTAAAEKPP